VSDFGALVKEICVEPHPDEDAIAIEVARIDDYQLVVGKGQFKSGEKVIYIPEQSVLPEPLIAEMGLEGRLGGSAKNVVKPIKLRKVLSQGLAYKPQTAWPEHWVPEYDAAGELGITKYEPPIPAQLAGQVERFQPDYSEARSSFGIQTLTYTEINNVKAGNDLQEGEPVVMTEKLHGTCTITGIAQGRRFVSSKGQAGKWLVLKEDPANLYWRAAFDNDLFDKLEQILQATHEETAILYGETYGPAVQDLHYGLKPGQIGYRAFDLKLKSIGFVDYTVFKTLAGVLEIPTVPEIYYGPYDKDTMLLHSIGNSKIQGANHIREGVVVKPLKEREDNRGRRVVYKSISPAYSLRKGGTEFQ
jgi:RNA ligase (TIGR02306 family)